MKEDLRYEAACHIGRYFKYPNISEWSGKYEGEWREGEEQPEKEERPNSSLLTNHKAIGMKGFFWRREMRSDLYFISLKIFGSSLGECFGV